MALPLLNRTGVVRNPVSTPPAFGTTQPLGALVNPIQDFNPVQPGVVFNGIYTPFYTDDIISNQQEEVTKGLWSNNVGSLLTFFTSSTQTAAQKQYYYETFQSASTSETAAPQFSIAYGHIAGSGSAESGASVADYPSKAIYSQFRQLLLEPNDTKFTINGIDTNHIYVLSINRARMRERLDEGNFEVNIQALSGSGTTNVPLGGVFHTGSNVKALKDSGSIKLIDDSTVSAGSIGSYGKVYNLVSGSIATGVYNTAAPHYYGLFYPQQGIAILNADTLNISCSFNTVTGSNINGDNSYKLFTAISGAAATSSLAFQARSAENVKSAYYFVRVKNAEYNFTNNPSFVTGSDGDFIQSTFVGDPRVYITTVGLYNNRQELLAVAKLSKPLMKSFTHEANIKVKLNF